MVQEFIPGQRWINDAELQLGLGTILSTDHRTVTVLFLATGDTRVYAKSSAPLSRVAYGAGDKIRAHEGWTLTVTEVKEEAGLLTYIGIDEAGEAAQLSEGELDNFIQLNRPTERLFNAKIDHPKWFDLRYQTLQHANFLARSELRGLTGGRTSLLPHQLYIAHEVAHRYAPRVLLADEVGLGKTIEAGLIMHQQILTERAQRVLIVVPESLVHQWLVEMLRRFNLAFSIFDEERCLTAEEGDNPFHDAQLVLCSLEFLVGHPGRQRQAVEAGWDLLVVDEAHHLAWAPDQSSPEYDCVEALARQTAGVILLTATPEQLGKESHFARLRLLDADRFPDFDQFLEEERHYQPIAQAVEELLDDKPLSSASVEALRATINEADSNALLEQIHDGSGDNSAARTQLVEQLLDRHGTGRVLFRNTRAAVRGFPRRQLHAYPLALPEAYRQVIESAEIAALPDNQQLLSPELLYQEGEPASWTTFDPRMTWLQDQLKTLKNEKVLVITHNALSAMDIAERLRIKTGIHAAVFHEHMSMIERDRAAAYFADREYGSPVLICSEIGSEGRNFQFAHHLVLFDLPLNPDLLEQRIGRLDRIGQSETIQIHVPYLEASPQAVMFRWYHEGLGAFEQTCPAGHTVASQVEPMLIDALHLGDDRSEALDTLIATTRNLNDELNEALQRGRDRLLEYNSCRPGIAHALVEKARAQDRENTLLPFLEQLFDCYGVDSEEHSELAYVIRPSEKMQNNFPGLFEDGMTITCDRDTALANEDMQFITWDHPMVTGAIDMVLSCELGNSAITTIKQPGIAAGTLIAECIYLLEGVSSKELQARRYLPPTMIRVAIDQHGKDHSATLPHELISSQGQVIDKDTARKVLRAYKETLRQMVERAEAAAQRCVPDLLAAAHKESRAMLEGEINRLKALRRVNPNVRDEEIDYFQQQWQAVDQIMEAASLRLDAVRVVITL